MVKKNAYKVIIIFLAAVAAFLGPLPQAFASRAELEEIENLEKGRRPPAPEMASRPRVEFGAKILKDPFQEPRKEIIDDTQGGEPAMQAPPPSLKVQGMIWGGNFPQAIINNKVVKTGDSVEGARVLAIDSDGVTVAFGAGQFTLPSPASGGSSSE